MRRSWLLVPLSDDRLVEDAWSIGADVIALDLMELVAEERKPHARERARDAIGATARGGAQVFVQVDKELLYADLMACVWPGLSGIIVPRLESSQEVAEVDEMISRLEKERGLSPNSLRILASVETARGNLSAMEIALASPRLWGMTLGRADLVMDLRPEPSGEIHLMDYLMQRLITVANAAGLVPIGAWWRAPARGLMASPDETYEAAYRGRAIGYKGSMCVLPEQVEPLNRGFTPSPDEVMHAQRLVAALSSREDALQDTTPLDGRIIDLSTVESARRLIDYAQDCAARNQEKARVMRQAAKVNVRHEEVS